MNVSHLKLIRGDDDDDDESRIACRPELVRRKEFRGNGKLRFCCA